jgi:hypothetical protein
MTQFFSRSPEQLHEPALAFPDAVFPLGTPLAVGQSEAVVLVRDGLVVGTVGPGQHVLDPNALPFLWNLRDASGQALRATLVFVSLAELGGRWAVDESGVSAFGNARYRVTDPVRLVQQGALDPAATLRHVLRGEITRGAVQLAIREAASAGWQVHQLAADPSRLAEHARQLANAELAAYGMELSALTDLSLSASAALAPAAAAPAAPTYEMLWDCRHCGTQKLLGLTHRCCPTCGSPQNAAERYFPAEADKVAVHDHVYVGADRVCRYCQNGNSRASKHCGTCGGPLDEGTDLQRRSDQIHGLGAFGGESADDARRELAGVAKPPPPAPKKRTWGLILASVAGCLVLGFIGLIVVMLVWTKPAGLQVAGHEWKREIDVERFGPVEERDWCDELPSGASVKGRSRAVRSHDQVQKGEKCSTRKRDNGDGTFSESRECEPVYEDKPVYSDECRYTIDKWSKQRTLTAGGNSVAETPKWPELTLAKSGQCLGCEREGKRRESYSVRFVAKQGGDTSTCSFDEAKWQSFKPNSSWLGEVGVVGGVLNCGSLKAQ